MKHEVTPSKQRLPGERRRRFGRLVRFGAYALGALVVIKVAMIMLSLVVSIAVVGVIAALIAVAIVLLVRR